MKQQRIIAWSLFAVAFLVLSGLLLEISIYWFAVDIIVILVCSGSGFVLIRNKNQAM